MAPFADTMSFVYSYASKFAMAIDYFQNSTEVVHSTELRRHIEKTSARVSTLEVVHDDFSS